MKKVHVAAAIILRNGHLFAAARGYGEQKGFWEFPGGKLEPGETPETALVREIQEELAVKIRTDEFLTTVEYDYPAFHLIMDCFLCTILEGEPTPMEGQECRWLTAATSNSVSWLPPDAAILPMIEERLEKI